MVSLGFRLCEELESDNVTCASLGSRFERIKGIKDHGLLSYALP